MIKTFLDFTPQIDSKAWLAENAVVIGEVRIEAESSIWYHTVIRGDVGEIRIGKRTSIQDGAMVHCTKNRSKTYVGNEVVVGHHAILHGCYIEDRVLIGMGATVLDGAFIPSQTIVAAGALIPEEKKLEAGYVYAGIPARPLRKVKDTELAHIEVVVNRYVSLAKEHKKGRIIQR